MIKGTAIIVFLAFATGAFAHGRIVGGENASIEDFPYQVSILFIDTPNCGGSIVSKDYILSAAHCFVSVSADDTFIRAGSSYATEGGQFRGVSLIMQHNQYNHDTHDYDLSILKLDESLIFGPGVQPIQLAPQDATFRGIGVATGWGRLSENGPNPFQLQKVDIPLLERDICNLVYGDRVTARMICGGYNQGGKDTCQGDSGGPYVISGNLVGITSWGDGCASANSPGVYTQVSFFSDYIKKIIE